MRRHMIHGLFCSVNGLTIDRWGILEMSIGRGDMTSDFCLQLWLAPVRNWAWVSAHCGHR